PLRRGSTVRQDAVLYRDRRSAQLSRPCRSVSEFSGGAEGPRSRRCAIGDERTGAAFLLADQEHRRRRPERPPEWCIIRRILDKRHTILLPDGGLSLMTHGYAANLAHAVLLAIDNPTAAAGQIYNCGDEEQLSLRQGCEGKNG